MCCSFRPRTSFMCENLPGLVCRWLQKVWEQARPQLNSLPCTQAFSHLLLSLAILMQGNSWSTSSPQWHIWTLGGCTCTVYVGVASCIHLYTGRIVKPEKHCQDYLMLTAQVSKVANSITLPYLQFSWNMPLLIGHVPNIWDHWPHLYILPLRALEVSRENFKVD